MPTFYNFRQNGVDYSFDDVFVPSDLFREGNLFTWGYGSGGALGNAAITNSSTPVTTFAGGTNWKQISGGGNNPAAIKTDGTLWTWGFNSYGKLGIASTVFTISTPVTTFAGGTNWKQVSCGENHMAAIKTDGTLWTWGRNTFIRNLSAFPTTVLGGQLGTAGTTNRSTPITTFAGGTNWKQVSCGLYHTAAIKTDGTLWMWGANSGYASSFGQLGINVISDSRSTPVTTFAGGTNWKQVSCGGYNTAAIKTDGTLWTWGYSYRGQLGNAAITSGDTPVTTFAGGTNWKQVSCANFHMAAIKTDGTLWTWGGTFNGALGNGTTSGPTNRISTPITTFAGGNNWKQVSLDANVGAAIKTDGTLWTWGSGFAGQLGNASTTDRSTPVTTFAGGNNWKQANLGGALTYNDPVI